MTHLAWFAWGLIATLVLTGLLTSASRLGWTRLSLMYLLGTLITPARERAKLYGTLIHLLNGWILAWGYRVVFVNWGGGWERGALLGGLHGLTVLVLVLPLMPAYHPRMASEEEGPLSARFLEPPGFFGLHYGTQTPMWILFAHVVYGVILGVAAHITA